MSSPLVLGIINDESMEHTLVILMMKLSQLSYNSVCLNCIGLFKRHISDVAFSHRNYNGFDKVIPCLDLNSARVFTYLKLV